MKALKNFKVILGLLVMLLTAFVLMISTSSCKTRDDYKVEREEFEEYVKFRPIIDRGSSTILVDENTGILYYRATSLNNNVMTVIYDTNGLPKRINKEDYE